jgi:hypothetical protein
MSHLCQMVHRHQDGVVELETGRFVMKSMKIEIHGDATIENG